MRKGSAQGCGRQGSKQCLFDEGANRVKGVADREGNIAFSMRKVGVNSEVGMGTIFFR
jgi:hypothetical protein